VREVIVYLRMLACADNAPCNSKGPARANTRPAKNKTPQIKVGVSSADECEQRIVQRARLCRVSAGECDQRIAQRTVFDLN